MATLFVLVGAEGMQELESMAWPGVRKATPDEERAFNTGLEVLSKQQGMRVADWYVDGMGRPYWLLAVEENADPRLRARAERYKRIVHLLP